MEAVITITLAANGQMAVNGAIDNKLVAFGMLELAKEAINEYHRAAQQRVQPVGADALNHLKIPS